MATEEALTAQIDRLENLIYEIRGQKVMLDRDLAAVYGVTTGNLNKAVKRNCARFPADFAFQLTRQEVADLRFQFGISSSHHGGRRYLPYVFTEHGAIMAANVLNSTRAAQMSVFVVRAFVRMRAALSDNRGLARKLAALEKELKERLDVHEAAIVTILQRVMDIIDPPALPEPSKKDIGFHIKEAKGRYSVHRKKNCGLRS
jgi:phage regulator Rha-like protein